MLLCIGWMRHVVGRMRSAVNLLRRMGHWKGIVGRRRDAVRQVSTRRCVFFVLDELEPVNGCTATGNQSEEGATLGHIVDVVSSDRRFRLNERGRTVRFSFVPRTQRGMTGIGGRRSRVGLSHRHYVCAETVIVFGLTRSMVVVVVVRSVQGRFRSRFGGSCDNGTRISVIESG